MSVIFLLIPLSVVIAAVFLGAFIWAVRSGQYEDTCTPSMRLLLHDNAASPAPNAPHQPAIIAVSTSTLSRAHTAQTAGDPSPAHPRAASAVALGEERAALLLPRKESNLR